MPEAIPIILGVIGAAGLGESIYSMTNQPGTPKATPPTPAQAASTAGQTQNQQVAALQSQFPNIQAATGGSLSPDSWAQMSELLSGQANSPGIGGSVQALLEQFFGGSNPGELLAGNENGTGNSTTGLTRS
jgi:hypothetical protein